MDDLHLEPFPPRQLQAMRTALNRWYARHGRVLPWRETADPYQIWISEIMLQQTTVKAVIPYYERFLSRFPTVQALAAASEADVLKAWEGLGYYSRGRNLRLAAIRICEVHSGEFPHDLAELQRLPGVGRYTAGAIRSFGFNMPAPIVEANTLRLYCRLLGYEGDPRSRVGQELLWEFATRLQPASTAGHLNQALMEVGGQICTPVNPNCPECPVVKFCQAFAQGNQHRIPMPKSRPEVTQIVDGTVALRSGSHWLVRQRGPAERWAGMWDFPRFPLESMTFQQRLSRALLQNVLPEAVQKFHAMTDILPGDLEEVLQIRHSVTRYRIRLICFRSELAGRRIKAVSEDSRWCTLEELRQMPMPVTGRQFAEQIAE